MLYSSSWPLSSRICLVCILLYLGGQDGRSANALINAHRSLSFLQPIEIQEKQSHNNHFPLARRNFICQPWNEVSQWLLFRALLILKPVEAVPTTS